MQETAARLRKQKAEGRNTADLPAFTLEAQIEVRSGLVPPLGPQPACPPSEKVPQGYLAVQTRPNLALFSESTDRLTSACYYNLLFQSCSFCRPDSLALPSHAIQLDSQLIILLRASLWQSQPLTAYQSSYQTTIQTVCFQAILLLLLTSSVHMQKTGARGGTCLSTFLKAVCGSTVRLYFMFPVSMKAKWVTLLQLTLLYFSQHHPED